MSSCELVTPSSQGRRLGNTEQVAQGVSVSRAQHEALKAEVDELRRELRELILQDGGPQGTVE